MLIVHKLDTLKANLHIVLVSQVALLTISRNGQTQPGSDSVAVFGAA